MIINKQLLSIPPFISASWKDIELLLSDGASTLNIYLKNGTIVKISNLLKEDLDLIFKVHQDILLNQTNDQMPMMFDPLFFQFSGPLLDHDPDLADASPLPDEVKLKLKSLLESLPKFDKIKLPEPHPDCNCPHCQVMSLLSENKDQEEIVSDEELHFSTWVQERLGDHLFKITHPFNDEESYFVSLDTPVSCSCGHTACEHLEHVLRH